MKRSIGVVGSLLVVFTVMTGTASAASPAPSSMAAKMPAKVDVKQLICNGIQAQVDIEAAKAKPNPLAMQILTAHRDAVCPVPQAPLAVVTISPNGCEITAQGSKGAVITYGAMSPDGLRGRDAEPVTITDANKVFTDYTGAAVGLNVYVTVTNNGKVLATKTAAVTAKVCTVPQPNGGYPAIWANAPQDSQLDVWGFYIREGVSYTAYRVYADGRQMPAWGYRGTGGAKLWPSYAQADGIPVDTTPHIGDAAISTTGSFGQAYYVDAVNGDGTIQASTYNADSKGNYSHNKAMPIKGLVFVHF